MAAEKPSPLGIINTSPLDHRMVSEMSLCTNPINLRFSSNYKDNPAIIRKVKCKRVSAFVIPLGNFNGQFQVSFATPGHLDKPLSVHYSYDLLNQIITNGN